MNKYIFLDLLHVISVLCPVVVISRQSTLHSTSLTNTYCSGDSSLWLSFVPPLSLRAAVIFRPPTDYFKVTNSCSQSTCPLAVFHTLATRGCCPSLPSSPSYTTLQLPMSLGSLLTFVPIDNSQSSRVVSGKLSADGEGLALTSLTEYLTPACRRKISKKNCRKWILFKTKLLKKKKGRADRLILITRKLSRSRCNVRKPLQKTMELHDLVQHFLSLGGLLSGETVRSE